jgi:hypothetical protein
MATLDWQEEAYNIYLPRAQGRVAWIVCLRLLLMTQPATSILLIKRINVWNLLRDSTFGLDDGTGEAFSSTDCQQKKTLETVEDWLLLF